ncbi:MAG: DUF4157 domain-containing protein [Candidatus Parcubacteria bacterium]|nr:DUF4157 domain-containing protein [Leptolyngbyaceae cyanobacterium LF-bin-113]
MEFTPTQKPESVQTRQPIPNAQLDLPQSETGAAVGIPLYLQRSISVQPKLTVGESGDVYEQEADRVAGQVMNMSNAGTSQIAHRAVIPGEEIQTRPLTGSITPLVQQEATLEEEESVQMKASLQRSPDGNLQTDKGIESRLNQSNGGGSPLSDEVRSFMEPRFGADFNQVRAHTDGTAIQMNRDLNAQAFTHKQDVYFGAGKTPAKDALTAHELTHVVQQTATGQTKRTAKLPTVQLKCSACEREEAKVQRLPSVLADDATTQGEDLPGAPSACIPSAALPYARSGILRGLGGTVGEKFEIRAEWSSTPRSSRGKTSYCAAECGEYHQFIKGHMLSSPNKDGSNLTDVSPRSFSGQKINENSFQEDGLDGNPSARYGHRKELQTMDEEYKPSRMTGSKYIGRDFPNVSIGTFADIDLTFLGKLIDTCNSTENQSASWRVQYRGVIRP